MAAERSNMAGDVVLVPTPPTTPTEEPGKDLHRLGEELKARVEDVLKLTVELTAGPEHDVDAVVQDSFERIGRSSTIAVARWIAGESMEVAIEAGRETWEIFGELAVHRAASLNEVTWRCFWWRNAMAEVLRESAVRLDTSPEALAEALNILQLSLEFSLLRMCECFETERQRTDEELAHRDEELAFLATHDSLTGLPNRTLILDRVEQILARSRRSQRPAAALFVDLDNFKDINDTLGHSAGDELLRAVAARLDGVIRDSDALGRLGGDEFVVISEDLSLAVAPELVAERLLEALKQPFRLGADKETRVTVTASIGIGGDRRADLRRGAAAQRRHRHVPGQVGRQEPLLGVRDRHAGDRSEPHGTGDGPARSPCEGRVLPRLPADDRPQRHEPHRGGGADPLAPSRARRPSARRLHPAARGVGADRRDRPLGPGAGLRPGRPVAQRPGIRSAWPSTSPPASSTPTRSRSTSKRPSPAAASTRMR